MKSLHDRLPAAICDQRRVQEFLNSGHYHLEESDFIAHLDNCPSCRDFLEAQAGEPEQWIQASQLLQTKEFDQASCADYSAATHSGADAVQPPVVKDLLGSLTPSEFPNHLGRLGPYEVTSVIGVGGMGVVLKAIDPSLDRVVAVKVMSPKLAHNENARKRFAREAKAAAAVLHPNVIPIHSVSSGTALPYLVMSYIRGGSLQKRLDQDGPLPLVEVLRIGSQIAAGLAAAHEQGLIHRDIKPENILLEEGVERVTITDFGLARSVDDTTITQMGSIAGTPQYMSPEQARGEQLDQKSDLFSLGSVLYSLSAGRPPYLAESSYGVMRKIIDDPPKPIHHFNPAIPEWFAIIVQKLMAKDKADRFESAGQVHKHLEACLSHVQQPQGYQLPDIPNSFPQSVQSRTKGVSFMTKVAAGVMTMAILAIVVFPFAQEQWSVQANFAYSEIDDPTLNMKQMEDIGFNVDQLTVEVAKRLIGKDESVTFPNVTSLEPEVAAVLAPHPGNLSLPAIQRLSPEAARALVSECKYNWLTLDGLKELSPDVARELAAAKCALRLGLDTVTPEVAEILATHDGALNLGLKSISPEVAEKLAMHQYWLSLNLLSDIDVPSAERLAKHRDWLSLGGLKLLTPDIAKALGSFDGRNLELNGLESLDIETAKELANTKCHLVLYLNGIKKLSPDVVNVLANGNSGLSFQGIEYIDSKLEQVFVETEKKLAAAGKVMLRPDQNDSWMKLDSFVAEGTVAKGDSCSIVWKLRGNSMREVRVQALHIKEGKSQVVSEVVCPINGQKSVETHLQLKVLDEPLSSKGCVVVPTLSVSLDGTTTKSVEDSGFTLPSDFSIHSVSSKSQLDYGSPYPLMWGACRPFSCRVPDDSVDRMIDLSKKGENYFVLILTWEPGDEKDDEEAPSK